MRRSLVLLLVLAVLSVTVIGATSLRINDDADAVVYTEQRHFGDPAAGEGLQIESLLTYNGQLHWDNTITLGPEIGLDCDFRFTSSYTMEREFYDETLSFYCPSNMGMSSTGSIDFTEEPETAWLADVLTAAAEQTPAGAEEYAVTIPLDPYLDYYTIVFDSTASRWYHWEDSIPFWETATEFFHVPVREGAVAKITISKDEEGNVYGLNYDLPDLENIFGSGIKGPDGAWYIMFTAQDADGNPLEGTAPQGIYRLPLREVECQNGSRTEVLEQVIENEVELVYATENSGNLYAMEDDTRLLLLAGGEAVLFDWATMEPIQIFPVGGHYMGNDGGWYETAVENDHVVILSTKQEETDERFQWTTVWAKGQDGLYEKVIDCDTTAGMEADSVYANSFFDGERFLRAGYVDTYWDSSIIVQLCDSQGLQYAATLVPNLRETEFMIQTENSRPTLSLVSSR